jgi:hypothetical protein
MAKSGKSDKIRDTVRPINEEIKTGSVDSILASMFHSILRNLGVNMHRFNFLMEKFLVDNRNRIPQNVKEKSSARGNLRRELLKDAMSWKVFCKALRFINVYKFEFTVKLWHANKKTTLHSMVVVLGEDFDQEVMDDMMATKADTQEEEQHVPEKEQ